MLYCVSTGNHITGNSDAASYTVHFPELYLSKICKIIFIKARSSTVKGQVFYATLSLESVSNSKHSSRSVFITVGVINIYIYIFLNNHPVFILTLNYQNEILMQTGITVC
jgi:hypothetical protein